MTHSDAPSLSPSPRPRRTKIIVAWIVCIATIAALVWYREQIDFEILRFRTKSSFVIVSDDGLETAFSLDEKQTRELLRAINKRTYSGHSNLAVFFSNWIAVFCKDSESARLRNIWVHISDETESNDVFEELFKITRHGVPEDSKSALKDSPQETRDFRYSSMYGRGAHRDLFEKTTMMERVY